ncbi:MAG: 1-phosphofructokinase family hexose kinase [Pseudorhodobacter sp.]|nr:MAG: 1-phosphofructokinase family hexose kinase [Pseudorhodobacter sp.]
MQPILTLTLNPALDISTGVGQVRPGEKLRCAEPSYNPGGGGLNVSRALHRLGAPSLALVALGGSTGERVAGLLKAEGILFLALKSPGDTRQSLTVTESTTGAQYRFLLPGPSWSPQEQAEILAFFAASARPGSIAVISGSHPPGVSVDFPARLAAALPACRAVLDTSGAALAEAVARPIPGLEVLRMDSHEAEGLAGRPLPSAQDTADFAESLLRGGAAATVIVARGAEGNVLVTNTLRLIARPPKVQLVSAVGAGDSFVAGLTLAMARAEGWPQALALATAAATAAVMTPATEFCRAKDVTWILPQVTISAL